MLCGGVIFNEVSTAQRSWLRGHIQINFGSMQFLCPAPMSNHPPPTSLRWAYTCIWLVVTGLDSPKSECRCGSSCRWTGTSRPCLSVNKMCVFVALGLPMRLPRPHCAYIKRPLWGAPLCDLLRQLLLSAQCARACPGCQWGINSWFYAVLIDGKGCVKNTTPHLKKNVEMASFVL